MTNIETICGSLLVLGVILGFMFFVYKVIKILFK